MPAIHKHYVQKDCKDQIENTDNELDLISLVLYGTEQNKKRSDKKNECTNA